MSDLYSDHEPEELTPEDLCRQAWARCSNWPEDRLAQQGLYQGLYQASERFKIPQPEIIAKCREQSSFCPTDHDLMVIAAEMFKARADAQEASRNREAEWRRQFGPPQPFDLTQRGRCSCGREWPEILKTKAEASRKLWDGLRAHFEPKKGIWPSFRDMAPIAHELGFDEIAAAWERTA